MMLKDDAIYDLPDPNEPVKPLSSADITSKVVYVTPRSLPIPFSWTRGLIADFIGDYSVLPEQKVMEGLCSELQFRCENPAIIVAFFDGLRVFERLIGRVLHSLL